MTKERQEATRPPETPNPKPESRGGQGDQGGARPGEQGKTGREHPWGSQGASDVRRKPGAVPGQEVGKGQDQVKLEKGPYAHLKDGPGVGPGKEFTDKQKKTILDENRRMNGGTLKSDRSGIDLAAPQQSRKGERPPANEAQVDHRVSLSKGGENSFVNAQVLSRKENRDKWDN